MKHQITKELLLAQVKQAIDVVEKFLNIYQFIINNLEKEDADILILGKERGKYMQLMSSVQSLKLYEKNLMNTKLGQILMLETFYEDFIGWISNVEKICEDNILKLPVNIFEKIYEESYAAVYVNDAYNEKREVLLLEEEIDKEDDDW